MTKERYRQKFVKKLDIMLEFSSKSVICKRLEIKIGNLAKYIDGYSVSTTKLMEMCDALDDYADEIGVICKEVKKI